MVSHSQITTVVRRQTIAAIRWLVFRLVLWLRAPEDSQSALVERFVTQLNARLATLEAADDREAFILAAEKAESEWQALLGVAPGTIRRRLTGQLEN